MRLVDAAACRAALPFEHLVPALRERFAEGAVVPQRMVLQLDTADGAGLNSLVMPAWLPGRCYGLKTVNIAPGNAARGLPTLNGVYLLFDAETGLPLAQIDAAELTARRTAAVSALAATLLLDGKTTSPAHAQSGSPASLDRRPPTRPAPRPRKLLVVGAGVIASLLPPAYRSVMPLAEVMVWARRPAAAAAQADRLAEQGLPARAVQDLAAAANDADIVSCATLATEPVIQGRWLKPGGHLDLIGSFTPAMRECDDEALRGARIHVDNADAHTKSGDLIGPLARQVIGPQDFGADLATLCRDGATAAPTGRTVFKSVGTALADLAAAMVVMEELDGKGGGEVPTP